MSKTIHAGTTPADTAVIVRIVDFSFPFGGTEGLLEAETEITPMRALALAAELIHAANDVLERELDERELAEKESK